MVCVLAGAKGTWMEARVKDSATGEGHLKAKLELPWLGHNICLRGAELGPQQQVGLWGSME